jgi:hypothetical protein
VIRTIALLVLLAVGTSCSLIPPLTLPTAKAQVEYQSSPELMQVFEQRIAEKLLSEMPATSPVRTLLETQLLVNRLEQLAHHSGLNRKLLTIEQRIQLASFDNQILALQFEVQYWRSKNHLAELNYLNVAGNPIKQDVILKTVEENIRSQIALGVFYPQPLAQAALLQIRQLPKTAASDSLLELLETKEFVHDLGSWQLRKLEPYFDPADLPQVLATLEAQAAKEEPLIYPVKELYSDTRYDIRFESDPEQLTLDIVSLHLEEALRFSQRRSSATIIGVEASFPRLLNVSREKLMIDLEAITSHPAFEFQALAYQAAGEMLADHQWAFNWQRTLALAYGQWTLNRMAAEMYFLDQESRLGLHVQKELFTQLSVVELKLALSMWTYEEARSYLIELTPYNPKQVDRMLNQLLAENGSYAAAAIVSNQFDGHGLELTKFVSNSIALGYPDSLEAFLARINEVAASTGS